MPPLLSRTPRMPQLNTGLRLDEQTQLDGRHDSPIEGVVGIPAVMQSVSRDRSVRSTSSPDSQSEHQSEYLFVVMNDPSQLKDPRSRQNVRRHVMGNYLWKQTSKPGHRPAHQSKAPFASSRSPLHHSRQSLSKIPTASIRVGCGLAQPLIGSHKRSEACSSSHFLYSPSYDGDTPYLRTKFVTLPPPVPKRVFNSLPPLDDPLIVKSTDELKLSCARHFASKGLSTRIIPTLLKAKHAFLSTLCISSAHDDIMQREARPLHQRKRFESEDRIRIKIEVIGLINRALDDPNMCFADVTTIAIFNVMCSEVMSCDDHELQVHQHGLRDLVRERGGLDKLGLNGQLASIITIKMFIISALLERPPDLEYRQFASRRANNLPGAGMPVPESPLFCRGTGFDTAKGAFGPKSPVYHLLELLRQLTSSLTRDVSPNGDHGSAGSAGSAQATQQSSTAAIYDRILAFPKAQQLLNTFESENERYILEALRLTAMVYAHALRRRVPFSRAAIDVEAVQASTERSFPSSLHVRSKTEQSSLAIHVQICRALQRTDFGQCWDNLIGVLFFVTLVAGACANPRAVSFPSGAMISEEAESRKWLATITVRCTLILGFEHGPAVLETLKRLVDIEEYLSNGVHAQATQAAEVTASSSRKAPDVEPLTMFIPGPRIISFPSWTPYSTVRLGPQEPPLSFDEQYPLEQKY